MPASRDHHPLDKHDQWLLDELQTRFPLCQTPWDELGTRSGLNGSEVLRRVRMLKADGLIRQIGPIFDSKALGYTSVLVAARVEPWRIEFAADVINQHPGVSHNYRRDAEYNLWFTLAVPPGESLEDHLERLARDAHLQACRPMPALKTYRIGVRLHVSDDEAPAPSRSHSASRPRGRSTVAATLTELDKQIVRITQEDLPLEPRPFDAMCDALGMRFEDLKAWMHQMEEAGVLRRFAAILRHREVGFTANGMVVWQIADEHVDEAGRIAAEFEPVSHCYQRPSYPDWPYNLYTMIHAHTTQECQQIADEIAVRLAPLGVLQRRILYSSTEYKKERVSYFTPPHTALSR